MTDQIEQTVSDLSSQLRPGDTILFRAVAGRLPKYVFEWQAMPSPQQWLEGYRQFRSEYKAREAQFEFKIRRRAPVVRCPHCGGPMERSEIEPERLICPNCG